MIDHGCHNLLGIRISAVDYETTVERIIRAARTRTPLGVSALAVHGVMTGVLDATHRHRLNQLEVVVPDGQPVRWGLNLIHRLKLSERVYGPRLMVEACAAAESNRLPIYLFGSTDHVLEELASNLNRRFPALVIAGKHASEFRPLNVDEKQVVIEKIKNSGAQITFVGLGCPRQEIWTYEFKNHLQMPVVAVGAAFNFHAGDLPQAPAVMQRWGLEWLYRLLLEPGRLWRRYLLLNPYYVWLVFLQWSGIRRFEVTDTCPPTQELLPG